MLKQKIKKTYNEALKQGYSKTKVLILCICCALGLLVGYLGVLALEGAILMWVFNLLAPLVGITLALTFWQGVAIVFVWKVLKSILRGIFTK